MLSKHPEKCRFPHGHTRRIEVVVSTEKLNKNDMVVDFKALKNAVEPFVEMFDHSMAINSTDPLLPELQKRYPDGIVVYEDKDPTTEVMAKDIFDFISDLFEKGWSDDQYKIPAKKITLERVRVWETPQSWAEFGRN